MVPQNCISIRKIYIAIKCLTTYAGRAGMRIGGRMPFIGPSAIRCGG
jgi:hypothetical protein